MARRRIYTWWPDGYFFIWEKNEKRRGQRWGHPVAALSISLLRSGVTRILFCGERSNAICDPFRAVRHPDPPLRTHGFPLDSMGPHHRQQPTKWRRGCGTDGQGTTRHVNREDKKIRESCLQSHREMEMDRRVSALTSCNSSARAREKEWGKQWLRSPRLTLFTGNLADRRWSALSACYHS